MGVFLEPTELELLDDFPAIVTGFYYDRGAAIVAKGQF